MTSPDAHGNDDVLSVAALAFEEGVADHAGAGHTEGMADSDGATVDVDFREVDVEFPAGVERNAGEGPVPKSKSKKIRRKKRDFLISALERLIDLP